MKFLRLNEDNNEPEQIHINFDDVKTKDADIDDDYKALDYPESMFTSDDKVPAGPKQGPDVGIADCIMTAITEEYAAIKSYNSIVATMEATDKTKYEAFINVLLDITAEENLHVGQLQEILKQLSPNAKGIEQGQAEAKDQLTAEECDPEDPQCVVDDVDDEM